MRQSLYFSILLVLSVIAVFPTGIQAADRWQAPLDATSGNAVSSDSTLTLNTVLGLVAADNPTPRALYHRMNAARERVDQAGLWSNPELATEFEEIGWDAPGLKESEITISLSQEFEIFGQRGARRALAQAGLDALEFDVAAQTFDLYLETKQRFYSLVHAQERWDLSMKSVELAESIVSNIDLRIGKGAALQSELLLAQLELRRMELARDEAQQVLQASRLSLTSLWSSEAQEITVVSSAEPNFSPVLEPIIFQAGLMDSTRTLLAFARRADIIQAKKRLAAAEAKPSITLSGGYKRLEANNSNSFLVGIALPLPLWNRNQGTRQSLEFEKRALQQDILRARAEIRADLQGKIIRLRQLIERHDAIDGELLPTAESVYLTLKNSYDAGRLPYTSLLEAERTLIDLRFELNDLLLSIQEQIISIEAVTGLTVNTDISEGIQS